MFNASFSARMINMAGEHFCVVVPFFYQMRKDLRDDLVEHMKDNGGRWSPVMKGWEFPSSSKVPIFKILQSFNIRVVMPGMSEAENQEKKLAIQRAENLIVKAEPTKILAQVPVDLVGPNNPAVLRVLQTQYSRLEAEFKRLHQETGVCKTKMREILQNCVPKMISLR